MTLRRALLLIVLLSLVIVGLLVALKVTSRPQRAVTLANGVQIEFLGSAVGEAEFTTERPWHRTARRWLPTAWTTRIPSASRSRCSSGTNSVTFYFRVHDPAKVLAGAYAWDSYMVEDDEGSKSPISGGICGSGSGASTVYGLIVRQHPRRQKEFLFHFLDANGTTLASLRIPNPITGPFPEWQTQSLPQTKTVQPITLTLQSLQEAGSARWPSIRPRWELTSSEPAWAKARVRSATFTDATGNEGQHLSPRESAWKLRTLVFRERPEDFTDAERVVLTNLAVPAPGTFTAVDQTVERTGVKLNVQVLVGPGEFHLTNGVERGASTRYSSSRSTSSDGTTTIQSWGSSSSFLLLEAHGVKPDDELVLKLTDERGRVIKVSDSSGYDGLPNGGRAYKRDFTTAADVKSLRLEILVNRPLPFEFLVNPADVLPAKPRETQQ